MEQDDRPCVATHNQHNSPLPRPCVEILAPDKHAGNLCFIPGESTTSDVIAHGKTCVRHDPAPVESVAPEPSVKLCVVCRGHGGTYGCNACNNTGAGRPVSECCADCIAAGVVSEAHQTGCPQPDYITPIVEALNRALARERTPEPPVSELGPDSFGGSDYTPTDYPTSRERVDDGIPFPAPSTPDVPDPLDHAECGHDGPIDTAACEIDDAIAELETMDAPYDTDVVTSLAHTLRAAWDVLSKRTAAEVPDAERAGAERLRWPSVAVSPRDLLYAKRLEVFRYVERCEKSGDPTWAARWRMVLEAYDGAITRWFASESATPPQPAPPAPVASLRSSLLVIEDDGGNVHIVGRTLSGKEIADLRRHAAKPHAGSCRFCAQSIERLLDTIYTAPPVPAQPEPIAPAPFCQPSCGNCGDDAKHRIPDDQIKWTESGDALCSECGAMRDVEVCAADGVCRAPIPPADQIAPEQGGGSSDTYCNECATPRDDCERARVPDGLACCAECRNYGSHNAPPPTAPLADAPEPSVYVYRGFGDGLLPIAAYGGRGAIGAEGGGHRRGDWARHSRREAGGGVVKRSWLLGSLPIAPKAPVCTRDAGVGWLATIGQAEEPAPDIANIVADIAREMDAEYRRGYGAGVAFTEKRLAEQIAERDTRIATVTAERDAYLGQLTTALESQKEHGAMMDAQAEQLAALRTAAEALLTELDRAEVPYVARTAIPSVRHRRIRIRLDSGS